MISGHPNPFVRQRPDLPWPPPTEDNDRSRTISKRVWKLANVHEIAKAQLADEGLNLIIPVTSDCAADIQKLELSASGLAKRMLNLNEHHYDKSMWCKSSRKEGVKVREEMLWLPSMALS